MNPFPDSKGASPKEITDRDRAYVTALYELFHEAEFDVSMIRGRRLPSWIGERYGVTSDKLADKTVLAKRLPQLGLIAFSNEGKIKLTEAGMSLAQARSAPALPSDLIGTYRRFGQIGPVYEVVRVEDADTMTICLVESGRTASYPVVEVRQDPLA